MFTVSVIIISSFFLVISCYAQPDNSQSSIQEVKKETKELIKALKNYSSKQRKEALKKAETGMEKIDRRIDKLENQLDEKWNNMDKNARKKARLAMKNLRKQRNELSQWYGSFKTSSETAWEQMKKGFTDAYETMSRTWEKTADKLDSDN
jgi:predicted RNase H-like nuclease (RuvC/YqgF family)